MKKRCTHGGQHMAAVLDVSFVDSATVVQPDGQTRGPMLTAVTYEPPPPRRPCSHHVVTAGGSQITPVSTSSPYPGSKAIRLGPSRRYLLSHPADAVHVVVSGMKDVTVPSDVSAG